MLPRTQVSALVLDVTGIGVPEFHAMLFERAEAAVGWLQRSIEACRSDGASGFYSRLHHPLRGWAAPMPEATGRLIPTLLEYSRFANRPDLAALAAKQARWLLSLQSLDGSFAGGLHYAGIKGEPSVFSTGQVMLGLIAVFDQTGQQEFLDGAAGAARWLCDELNDAAGVWLPSPGSEFQPAHYTTVCWAMLEVTKRTREPRAQAQAVRALKTISAWQQENGAIDNWGLQPDRPAFTENIADTIRGFWEAGKLLGDEGKPYRKIALRAATALREQYQEKGKLAGAYDPQFNADGGFACIPGHCHLARIWLTQAEKMSDAACFRAALECLYFVSRKQKMRATGTRTRGALPGSSPRWGSYWPLKYPSFSASSFVDGLLHLQAVMKRSSSEPTDPAPAETSRKQS